MARSRAMLLVLATAAAAIAVVAAGLAGKDWIREEWYIRKLQAGGPEERVLAAERLGEMRSVRAVPFLMRALRDEAMRALETRAAAQRDQILMSFLGSSDSLLGQRGVRIRKAIEGIGKPATQDLLRGIGEEKDWILCLNYVEALLDIHDSLPTRAELRSNPKVSQFTLLLHRLHDDPSQSPEVRRAASGLLELEAR